MTEFELVGYRFFESKKTGAKMVQLYLHFEATQRNGIQGIGTDTIFTLVDNLSCDPFIGAKVKVNYNRNGFVTEVDFI